jgi:hypothetical protein
LLLEKDAGGALDHHPYRIPIFFIYFLKRRLNPLDPFMDLNAGSRISQLSRTMAADTKKSIKIKRYPDPVLRI